MHSIADLPPGELQVAHDAATVLTEYRAYTPGSLFRMLLSKFRDDLRECLEMEVEGVLPTRASDLRPLSHLTSIELDTVSGAVMILLQDRFTRVMDDPALPVVLDEFRARLDGEKAEREQIRAFRP